MLEQDIKRIADALEALAETVKGNRLASASMAEALLALASAQQNPAEPRKRKAKTEEPTPATVEVVKPEPAAPAPVEPVKPAPAPVEPVKPEPAKPESAPVEVAKPEPAKPEPVKPARLPSLDEVKFALMSCMQDRGQDAALAIVRKFGVDKARDLKETDYAAVIALCKEK
jgi:outer membrane biosynthesis protein TonB